MTAKAFADRLATVPERALEALPSLPANPWRRRRSFVPGSAAAFGLGLAFGLGVALVLYLAVPPDLKGEGVPGGRKADGKAEPDAQRGANPFQ